MRRSPPCALTRLGQDEREQPRALLAASGLRAVSRRTSGATTEYKRRVQGQAGALDRMTKETGASRSAPRAN